MESIKLTTQDLLSNRTRKKLIYMLCILALQFQFVSVNTFAQYTKLRDFESKGGSYPDGSLILVGTYLYGMTYSGGANDLGTIFKIKPDGSGYVRLLNFEGGSNGSYPSGSLLSDGTFLYGMTSEGGLNNFGTIFKIKFDGSGYSKMFDFDGLTDGSYPYGDLISDGTFLYGMAYSGGEFDAGTIFKIALDQSSFGLLHEFHFAIDGINPYGSLTLVGSTLYGMTSSGGVDGFGNLFKISKTGPDDFTSLKDFGGSSSGSYPYGSLLSDGTSLYGMTSGGGATDDGVIFKINFDGSGFTNLHDLQGSADGSNPNGSLISDGTFLYGMASYYGNDYGTIFKIKTDGTGFVNLRSFNGALDGDAPYGSLVSDGTFLYGMTDSGGSLSNHGTIFKIKPDGSAYAKLFAFEDTGFDPFGSLISDGTFLYGMTAEGGANGYGTIFKIKPDGSGYSTLYDFYLDGSNPHGSLLLEGGYLYGMTLNGGANNSGVIFKIMPDGTGYTIVFDFDFGTNGDSPYGSLISDGSFLYGMTSYGGSDGGIIFKIKPDGTGYATLSDFTGPGAGWEPYGDLLFDGSFLYGMTYSGGTSNLGTIFKLNTDGSNYTTLYDFSAPGDGAYPNGSLISDGTFLYGMTQSGGMGGGTVFKIKNDGTGYSIIRKFAGLDIFDGSSPYGSLTFDGTYLYGLTSTGGANDLGTMFKMLPDGTDTTKLINFNGAINGSWPRGSLLLVGSSFYGMTLTGGVDDDGTIFKFDPSNACPDVATITATSAELTASAGDSYQWYYFGEPVTGETNQTLIYSTLEYGEYSVDVTKNGCTATANYNYLITGKEQELKASIQVFPNPVKENLSVTLPEANYSLKIIDPLGRVFLEQRGEKGMNELKTVSFTPGLYYLIAKSHDDVIVFKIQKQ